MCNNLDKEGYALTSFPNFLNHTSQDQALFQLESYKAMLEATRSPVLTMFIYSIYVPLCVHGVGQLPPCRSLCENSRKRVENMLNRAGVNWPFECSKFPAKNTGKLCISGPETKDKSLGIVTRKKGKLMLY